MEERYEHGLRVACVQEDDDLEAFASDEDLDPDEAWDVIDKAVA
jgi:hypothetical protein